MALTINPDLCQGHGRCSLINLDLFDVDDDGHGVVVIAEPGPQYATDIAQAVASCPEQAISYS
jgi:ferredoxin